MSRVSRAHAKELVGKEIYAVRRDGRVVQGRLTGLNGDDLIIEPLGGKAHTKAILPLALFDLLAIGTLPFSGFGFGGFPFGGFW